MRISDWSSDVCSSDLPGATISATATLDEVSPDDFDALILPGGVGNPDRLRMEKRAIELVRGFHAAGKPVAAICHGPWLLVEADIITGKTVTSWPSIRSEEHTSELQSLMRIPYAAFCLQTKKLDPQRQ